MSDLDPDSLSKLLVRDLKEHLSNRGLSTVGLKAELVKRLREAILLEQNENNCENDPEKTDEEPMDMDKDESSPEQFQSEEEKESSHDQLEEEASLAEEQRTEEQAQLQAEEQARILAEEQARLQAEEEARLHAEEKARIQAEEQARIQAEEQARIQAEEQARIQAENEARIQAEEEARIQAEEEARIQAEERARLHAEKQARLQAEEEARLQAEEEARLYAEEQAQLQAEEARLQAEKQARLLAEEEACLRAEEARLQAEEQARLLAEEEARIQAEEKARLQAEERARLRAQELARLRAEEEARLRAEEEAHLRAKEEARQEAEKARIFEEKNYQSISEERANDEYSNEMFVDNSMIVSENDKREQERTSEDIERKAREEEMRVEQERWLVEEQMRKVQEEHKKRLKAEEERRKKKDLERSSQEEQNRVLEEKIKSASQKRFLEEQRKTTEETSETNESILMEEDIRLPQAIEKVLALKSERAQELGIDPDTGMRPETAIKGKASNIKSTSVALVTVDEDDVEDDESLVKSKESKKRRRKRKKKTKLNDSQGKRDLRQSEKPSKEMNVDVDIEYVQEVIDITDPMYGQFMKIFERFKLTDVDKEKEEAAANAITDIAKETLNPMAFRKKPMDLDDDDDDKDDEKVEEEKPKLSKRKLKKLNRMSVAELKQKVNRPELVEMHDVTAKDPLLLLHLKASRNTVPVPRHWCFKRKYLQGKRGIEKPAFELPDFIKRTGIMEMRQALQEKEDQKTMKAKMRERVRPKLGKIDIDYQKLHDAFFKWQTKPKMTIHGDLYYEGKEFETRLKEKKPGDLSEDLRTALGMPTGTNAQKCPPPWLIAMQRYGPPPSYPNLKIPGLNAPIPEDCSFGYHAGGWGKPPVDEAGRPLYGDVFGTQVADNLPHIQEEEIDHTLWGELESESSEEEEDEEEEEEEDDEEEKVEDETGLVTPAEGLITPSGFSSIPAGMETPDMIELRKRKIESEIEGGETPALYTILPEKKTDRVGAAMMASTHVYDMSNTIPASKLKMQAPTSAPSQGIEVALDPSELEMDSAAMAARYEQTMREQQSQLEKEDLSDMVAEHAARQKNKRKKQQLTSSKPPKKYKEFKF